MLKIVKEKGVGQTQEKKQKNSERLIVELELVVLHAAILMDLLQQATQEEHLTGFFLFLFFKKILFYIVLFLFILLNRIQFYEAFCCTILPLINPYPQVNSIILIDNARVGCT